MIKAVSNNQSGFALLLSIVVASIVLAIGVTMLNITVKQLTLASVARESAMSFHAAEAGTDCIAYWRQANNNAYTAKISPYPSSAPNISCFGVGAAAQNYEFQSRIALSGDNYINEFKYQLDWANSGNEYCTEIDLYVMVAETNYSYNFASAGISSTVGNNGVKTCQADDVCNVSIVRGYNRACSDLASSILTVEREITAQF